MAFGAGEPSAKRAKVDEKEEEDPLVRRREEVVRLLEEASAKGRGNARAKKELLTLCADFEAKNDKLLGRLLPEIWSKIVDEYLHQSDLLALAMTCRFFRETTKDLGWTMETDWTSDRLFELQKSGKMASYSLGWFRWVCDTFEILPGFEEWNDEYVARVKGAVYEGDLLNYALFQGSVEILKWLMEEKGWETNWRTDWWAGRGGSVEVFEYLGGKGYEFDEGACDGAARGGHLEALKWLRGQDPPCRWNSETCELAAQGGSLEALKWLRDQDPPCPWYAATCSCAAEGGHLDVLKWARSQDPPCPWNKWTCSGAARKGHLAILKWLRSQDPPCPWSRSECRKRASREGHRHIVEWIDQQEDESDEESSYSDMSLVTSDSDRSYDSYGDEYF